MPARVFMLHGTMTMPAVRKDPDEIAAAWSARSVHDVGELADLPDAVGGLQLDRRPRPPAHHQVGLHVVEIAEHLQ
jgi:hypothetical protein